MKLNSFLNVYISKIEMKL